MKGPSDPQVNGGIYALDRDFGALAEAVGTAMWGLAGLTPKECAYLCIASDVCAQTLGLPFQMHVDVALANGADRDAVKEVLIHLAPEAGYVKSLEALVRLRAVYAAFDEQDRYRSRSAAPRAEEASIAPASVSKAIATLDPSYGDFVAGQMRAIWDRPGLTNKERAYLSLAVDVCEGTLGGPFRMHLDLASASGATREQMRDVLRFLAEFGASKVWRALEEFDAWAQLPGV